MNKSLGHRVANATKWSTVTEIAARVIQPVTNMVLARLLTPSAFGVVATITIIISFAEVFMDAGFQKYLVQHEFKDENDLSESTNVAFWTNLGLSFLIWGIIIVFRNSLARLVGSPEHGVAIAVACVIIPLVGLSSIQMSLYRRKFDYKTLFFVRMVSALVPFFVTIPLAFITHSFWALVVGNITVNAVNACLLTVRSSWKPKISYNVKKLQEMLSFSIWTLLEQVSIWATTNIGTFIVGLALSEHFIGLYKTSMSTVNSYMAIITTSTTTVLFSALSRLQSDDEKFFETFLKFQRFVAMLVLPMGVGMCMYRELVTDILLGEKWAEAAGFIGLWSLTSGICVVYSNYNSEVFRSRGKPKLSLLVQLLHLAVLVPALIIASKYDFTTLYVTRSLVRFQIVAVSLIVVRFCCGLSVWRIFKNTLPAVISTLVMACVGLVFKHFTNGLLWDFVGIFVCIVVYFAVIMCFPVMRSELLEALSGALKKIKITEKK